MANKTDLELFIEKNSFKLSGIVGSDTITPLILCDAQKQFDHKSLIFNYTGTVLYSRTSLTEVQLQEQLYLLNKYLGIDGRMEFFDNNIRYHIFVEKRNKSALSKYLQIKVDTRGVTKFIFANNALAFLTLVNGMLAEYIRWCAEQSFVFEHTLILPSTKPEVYYTEQWSTLTDRQKGIK